MDDSILKQQEKSREAHAASEGWQQVAFVELTREQDKSSAVQHGALTTRDY